MKLGSVSFSLLFSAVAAGLILGAACGAPDVVSRAQPVGSNGGASSSATGGSSSDPSTGGVVDQGGSSDTGGSVVTGGKSSSGGSATGGKGGSGGTSAKGGASGKGGTSAGGTGAGGRGGASGSTGTGGSTRPFGDNGGTTDTSSGGTGAAGGTGGTTDTTPATPPPTDSLAVYVVEKTTGATGQMGLNLRVINTTAQSIDMSAVTIRYWYQDEGLGVGAAFEVDYASVGDQLPIKEKMHGPVVLASPPAAGADHFIEISFDAVTIAAKGGASNSDQIKFNGRLHNSGYQGAVDITNDYSYNAGTVGYNKKITIHDKKGNLIGGEAPGGGTSKGSTVAPDAGIDASASADDSGT